MTILLHVRDLINDVAAEIKKIHSKMGKSSAVVTRQRELMQRECFQNASQVVQSTEMKKLIDAQTAVENYERTIAEFEKIGPTGTS